MNNCEICGSAITRKKFSKVCNNRWCALQYAKEHDLRLPKSVKKAIIENKPSSIDDLQISAKAKDNLRSVLLDIGCECYHTVKAGMYILAMRDEIATKCPTCKGNLTTFHKWPEHTPHCSAKCHANDKNTRDKVEATCKKRYGTTNVSQAQIIKDKKIETCVKNHGVEYPMQSRAVRKKTTRTIKKKYGEDNVSKVARFKKKREDTMLERYGSKNFRSSEAMREVIKEMSIEKYGTTHPSKASVVKKKLKETMLARYGCHAMQTDAVKMKCAENRNSTGLVGTRTKEVRLKGKIFTVEGYEDIALNYMVDVLGYKPRHIFNDFKSLPKPKYFWDGKERRYFPDFYIETDNGLIVVEVKSTYTAGIKGDVFSFDQLIEKAKAIHRLGHTFLVLIFSSRSKLFLRSTSLHNASPKDLKRLRRLL